jgi:lipid-A-disaccharide synthase
MPKFYLVAGEASGDLHGSNLIRELKQMDPSSEFRCYGGDLMKEQGATVVRHISELDFMGFQEVLLHLRTILRQIADCKADMAAWKPDALVLIDYPGFNLKIAEFAHNTGIPVYYYISPQLWAWKQGRIAKVRKFVTKMFVILPFEKEFYAKYGYDVVFVGHPLLDAIKTRMPDPQLFREQNQLDERPLVALLPGSRQDEIRRMLPTMLSAAGKFGNDLQFVIAGVSKINPSFYEKCGRDHRFPVVYNQTYSLLKSSAAAIITSGTATLEAALLDVPQVVCYKSSPVSFFIAKKLVKLKFISLVNLILDRRVVTELIQGDMNVENLISELQSLMDRNGKALKIKSEYGQLREILGGDGASATVAKHIMHLLPGFKNEE